MPTSVELPKRLQQLYDALSGHGDVAFGVLVGALEASADRTCGDPQWLSPYVTRLNRRLAKQRQAVKPGRLKGTLRLINL